MNRRLKILQIFNRYLAYGGEEGSVGRIGDIMHEVMDVEYFITSTREFLQSESDRWKVPFLAYRNPIIAKRLRRFQRNGHFDFWQVHNVFPVMSPQVYAVAAKLGVPIVQYLHNYRMSCVNGFFLNHGALCTRCIHGNFLPAFTTACWHESRWQSGWMGIVLKRLRRLKVFDQVIAWIALSESQKALHVEMGIPAERISVVPHFYEPSGAPSPFPDKGDVLFLGRLSPEKGVDVLLRAWAQVDAGGRRLLIAGDGPEMPALVELAKALGLQNVQFLGFLDKAAQREVWQRSAFNVVPSVWHEPFGMVALETWAQGRPLIVSSIGGLDEIVTHGEDGLKVEPRNSEALAAAIQQLLQTSPDDLHTMARAGWSKLVTQYNQIRWLEKYKSVYRRLV